VIAPIVLGFAAAGLAVVYVVYRYNLIYVYDSEHDTRGLHYPRALQQTLIGLYLAEVCLIGLLALGGGLGPLFLMILLLVLTVLVHISLNDALGPLLYNIPRTLAVPEEQLSQPNIPEKPFLDSDDFGDQTHFGDAEDMEDGITGQDFMHPSEQLAADQAIVDGPTGIRAVEGAEEAANIGSNIIGNLVQGKITKIGSHPIISRWVDRLDFWTFWISPDPAIKPNFMQKWLHPEIFEDYQMLKQMIPADLPTATYPEDLARHAFDPPSLSTPEPRLWIPRDAAGVSRQEVVHSGKVVSIIDEGAFLNENNRLEVDLNVYHPVLMERYPY
jgi:hypothetical protein